MLWMAAGLAASGVALAKGAIQTMFFAKLKTAVIITASVAVVTTASALSWQKVYEARDKGLPKTAIGELNPIIADAMQNKRYAEAIKAIATKIAFEGQIEGNKAEEKITRLQEEIEKAPVEMKPVMETILAHWYWQYFQQNRWRFMQRTQTTEAPGKDFTAWDLPRILTEIDKHFTVALANEKVLKSTPVDQFNDLLERGSMPDAYRPTMYDFLAHEAVQFYQAGEQGAMQAEDEFVLDVESPIFGQAADFIAWKPETTDTGSPTIKAIRLFQNLLAFHQNDKDKTAFADADLGRLMFGHNKADGENKNDRYEVALKGFVDAWADHEISAHARAQWATLLQGENECGEAHQIAGRGYELFPKSLGGAMCYNVIQQIESKSASIQTERVWSDPPPTLDVTYRNVTKVYFRAVACDWEALLKKSRWGIENMDDEQRKELLRRAPVKAWDANLPATSDYQMRTEKLPVPTDLKPGFYFIIASHDAAFSDKNNCVSYASVWVSDLALVVRTRHFEGVVNGFVLNATSGEPVSGAVIRSWTRNNHGWYQAGPGAKTDANGLFRVERGASDQSLVLLAEMNGQQLASASEYYLYHQDRPKPDSQTVFFTDRSLYRPGQTIYYKGISMRYDQEGNKYSVYANLPLTVVFSDPNGKEVARATHTTSDYGSFSGAFTAPRDRVTGQMQIRVAGRPSVTYVTVEEYKRPKFQVELAKPKEPAKLGAEVSLTGKAASYTGAAIGGAKVKWRVVRQVQFPPWCWWWRWNWPSARGESQAVAHGTATTGSDGSFIVKFIAKPDPSALEKDEPTFNFTINADVTDTTGETRSDSQTVRAGFTALQATLAANEWQTPEKPVELTISTQSLDGEGRAARGVVKIHKLKQPEKVARSTTQQQPYRMYRADRTNRLRHSNGVKPEIDPADPNSWELAEVAVERAFQTDASGKGKLDAQLPAGIYRAILETKDRFGKAVTCRLGVLVVDLKEKTFPVKVANRFAAEKWSVEPGESFVGFWGTGYDRGRAFVEVEHCGKILSARWTDADRTQEVFEQAVGEEMRGGFTIRLTYVRENQAYLEDRVVDVPWSNKKLMVKWEHFTSKLEPGKKETWTAVVSGPDARKTVAEMVAGLYDASLDQYQPHQWIQEFNVFRREYSGVSAQFENGMRGFNGLHGYWITDSKRVGFPYRHFPADLTANVWGYGRLQVVSKTRRYKAAAVDAGGEMEMSSMPLAPVRMESAKVEAGERQDNVNGAPDGRSPPGPDLSTVSARKNLNETAFFLPQLVSDAEGVVRMEFTMPEALTEWKFMGFAHDRDLRSGYLQDKVVTAKDLMVEPNPPRFVREGDIIEFTVKVSNQSAVRQAGRVKLTFADARTLKEMNGELGIQTSESRLQHAASGLKNDEYAFDVPAKESKTFAWRITVPDGMDFLTYKAVGATDRLSDGEEGYLPVLSRRILVTESLPLPIRGPQTRTFEFAKLANSGKSKTLKHETLTVQMVSQPAWYAVMALPYLMEYPHECSEQTFNRLYANALARFIANSDPKIRRIFDQWKGTPALDSPMEKNQDLKMVILEETPWYRQAVNESQARRNVGILFDANRLNDETDRTFRKLAEMQLGDGLWPWFPGCRGDEYITLYIVTGFGRLRHLGVENVDMSSALKALGALDGWMDRHYREIMQRPHPELYVPESMDAMYLYGRSFFLKDKPIAASHQAAVKFFLEQSKKFWVQVNCRQSQGHLAIGLKRFGDLETPVAIMKSIKEYSVSNEEMGMFWRDAELSWWWYRAPIETQALMVEAFDEVMGDAQAVEDCRVWLLKQKQTQDWKTTKATADAIYGLLLRGKNMLASDALVEVSLGGEWIKPMKVEAGTGFYEQRFVRKEIKPEMGKVAVKKTDAGVSWGSVHWQYLEDMTKVTPYEGTPLKLKKALYIKEATKKGQELKPVKGVVQVGDELVVRVELRVDRDMEYVHLKDQRGSGTEPVNVLSRTQYQDGLVYYESTRDTASHFFIHYLPKGVYVFEYSVRVQLKGRYQTGIAAVQCMYAPEFNSHSESVELEVK
jgi:hypothetical protein